MSIVVKCPKCHKLLPTRTATSGESQHILANNIKANIDKTSLQKKAGDGFFGQIASLGDAIGNFASTVGAEVCGTVGSWVAGEVIECECGFIGHVDLIGETDFSGQYINESVKRFNQLKSYDERFKLFQHLLPLSNNPSVKAVNKKQFNDMFSLVSKHIQDINPAWRRFVMVPNRLSINANQIFQLASNMLPKGVVFDSGLVASIESETLFIQHPLDPNHYLPFKGFDLTIAKEQCSQLLLLCQSLGASEITIEFVLDRNSIATHSEFASQIVGAGASSLANETAITQERKSETKETQNSTLTYHQQFEMPMHLPSLPKERLSWYESRQCQDWRMKAQQRLGDNANLLSDTFSLKLDLSSYMSSSDKTAIQEEIQYMVSEATFKNEFSSQIMQQECINHTIVIKVKYWSIQEIQKAINLSKEKEVKETSHEEVSPATYEPYVPAPKKKGFFGKLFG